jgi:hypothetical protein
MRLSEPAGRLNTLLTHTLDKLRQDEGNNTCFITILFDYISLKKKDNMEIIERERGGVEGREGSDTDALS